MSRKCYLTTTDNPFDQFEQFEDWERFDRDKHYYSLSYLARIVQYSESLSEEENDSLLEIAIDDIVNQDLVNLQDEKVHYKKIVREL